MPVAVVREKKSQPAIKQTNKKILSIKSHSFPTFSFYFIHFFYLSIFLYLS